MSENTNFEKTKSTKSTKSTSVVESVNTDNSAKFKLLCCCIKMIERRYNGKRSRLNLTGFCDRIVLKKTKFNEMVDKAPVEVILYLMGVLVKLIEDIEDGNTSSLDNPDMEDEDLTTDEEKERIIMMVMDRMLQEEQEERQRMIQAQVQYATSMAQACGFFQGGPPNVMMPGMGNYPMGSMYGGGVPGSRSSYRGNGVGQQYNAGHYVSSSSNSTGNFPQQEFERQFQQPPFQNGFNSGQYNGMRTGNSYDSNDFFNYNRSSNPNSNPPPHRTQQDSSYFYNEDDFDMKKFGDFGDFAARMGHSHSESESNQPKKRRPGRPKGAKNKPKESQSGDDSPKRGKGRPKGAKNKTKDGSE